MSLPDPGRARFEQILRRLMKAEARRITGKGIRAMNRHFVAPEIMTEQGQEVLIRFLNRVHDKIWVYDDRDDFICVARCLDELPEDERRTYRNLVLGVREERLAAARQLVDEVLEKRTAERPLAHPPDADEEATEEAVEADSKIIKITAAAEREAFTVTKMRRRN